MNVQQFKRQSLFDQKNNLLNKSIQESLLTFIPTGRGSARIDAFFLKLRIIRF